MNISPRNVRFDDHNLWVELSDDRTLGVPLVWFPRLLAANDRQRADFELTAHGIRDTYGTPTLLPTLLVRITRSRGRVSICPITAARSAREPGCSF